MKKQINPTIKAHLIRGAFYLLLLVAVCAIPFALAQRNATKRAWLRKSQLLRLRGERLRRRGSLACTLKLFRSLKLHRRRLDRGFFPMTFAGFRTCRVCRSGSSNDQWRFGCRRTCMLRFRELPKAPQWCSMIGTITQSTTPAIVSNIHDFPTLMGSGGRPLLACVRLEHVYRCQES